MACATLTTSELTAVVGDNEAHGEHRAGYNGVWSLTSVHAPASCFVPAYAGLNLEHFMDELFATQDGVEFFEPRRLPMRLERVEATAVRLSHEPSPHTGVASSTEFRVVEPHALDLTFRARLTRPPRAGRQFGFFWASYMHVPDAPGLHFRDPDGWLCALAPDRHGAGGANTVCHASVATPTFGSPARTYRPDTMAHAFSHRRFGPPLMWGRPGDGAMLYLQMFDPAPQVRLTMSPSGGGRDETRRALNPAWDWQLVIDEAQAGVEYRLRSRLVYKRYAGLREIDDLYRDWLAQTTT